jgi:hypothetical protein
MKIAEPENLNVQVEYDRSLANHKNYVRALPNRHHLIQIDQIK